MPVVIHIPHSSTAIPEQVRNQFCISAKELEAEIVRMTDSHTDDLFAFCGEEVQTLIYPASRLVVDPERFRDDAEEPMAKRGMGAVYTRTAHGQALRLPLSEDAREVLLSRFYDPHHARLSEMVQRALEESGECLILDAHSFPSAALPCDLDQGACRPDICLGTNAFHTPNALVAYAEAIFRAEGFSVAVDSPYAGALVPMAFWGKDERVRALMVEVNRQLYMDESTGERHRGYEEVRVKIQSCLARLCG